MAQPYVGEIRMFGGNFPPYGWMFCEGQLMPISENELLFNIIGTTYGGDGEETFALPDLRGRVPIHMGNGPGIGQNFHIGQTGGLKEVTLTTAQMPAHSHQILGSYPVYGSNPGSNADPKGAYPAMSPGNKIYSIVPKTDEFMNTENPKFGIGNTGLSETHNNMQPYLCVNFIICLWGIYPTPS